MKGPTRTALSLLLAIAAGCEISDADLVADPIETAAMVRVEVLGGAFVRVGERRMPDDEFLLRMRQRFRAAGPAAEDKPGLQILATPEGRDRASGFVERALEDLVPLGLRRYVLGEDEGG